MTSKKQTIINASMSLFNREGYQTPGVDRIAEASGVSKMTFYRHFSDKNDLINLILEEKHKKFIDDITHITNEKKSTKEKLFSILSIMTIGLIIVNSMGACLPVLLQSLVILTPQSMK